MDQEQAQIEHIREQLRADVIALYPPGAVREKWLRWVDEVIHQNCRIKRQDPTGG